MANDAVEDRLNVVLENIKFRILNDDDREVLQEKIVMISGQQFKGKIKKIFAEMKKLYEKSQIR